LYGEQVLARFRDTPYAGDLDNPDAVGQAGVPGQGNYIVLQLNLENGVITDARFQTYGCPAAIASGSWVAEWALGKVWEEAIQLTPFEVDSALGGLPPGKAHCADLAVNALKNALA